MLRLSRKFLSCVVTTCIVLLSEKNTNHNAAVGVVAAATVPSSNVTCNKNGGSAMSWDGTCTDRNYTYTEQCTVAQEGPDTCMVTSNACGCQVDMGSGIQGIGSAEEGCGNACIDFSTDIPTGEAVTCGGSGTSMSFDGACDAGLIATHFTPQCQFVEQQNKEGTLVCTVTEIACGCLFWTEQGGGDKNETKDATINIGALTGLCGEVDPCNYTTIEEELNKQDTTSSSSSNSNVLTFVIVTLLSSLVVSL